MSRASWGTEFGHADKLGAPVETTHQLTKIYQQLQRALTEVTNLQIQVMDMKDQLSLMSRQVGEMSWAIDWIIELQPLVEQFEGVDTTRRGMSLDGMLTFWGSDSCNR